VLVVTVETDRNQRFLELQLITLAAEVAVHDREQEAKVAKVVVAMAV
jgi:hypothetical protein